MNSMTVRCRGVLVLAVLVVCVGGSHPACAGDVEYDAAPVPMGTRISATFATQGGGGPEVLLDGDEATYMNPAANTAETPVSLYLQFPKPLKNLAGVRTGKSDAHWNYFPQEMHFFVDTIGDGKFDTYVGKTTRLGAAEQSVGEHLFARKPAVAHGLEIRVTKQSQKGLKRAFMMNELGLLYSDQTWDSDVDAPESVGEGGKAPMPVNVDINAPTPIKLIDPANKPSFNTIRSGEYKHAAYAMADADPPVVRFEWKPGSDKGFIETLVNAKVTLHAFKKGVLLSIPLDASRAPGVTDVGVRVRDAHGETYQWGTKVKAGQSGWQDARLVLNPLKHDGNWGGPAEHRGTIEEPVQLLAITFVADRKDNQQPAQVDVREVARNAFAAEDVAIEAKLNQLEFQLRTPRPSLVMTTQDQAPLRLRVKNDGALAVRFVPRATFQAFDGDKHAWTGEALSLEPGQERVLDIDTAWPKLGWFRVNLTAADEKQEASVGRGNVMIACIEPNGTRGWRPGNDFGFSVGGALATEATAEVAALMGVDWDRGGGGWRDVEPQPGTFKWDRMDEQARIAKKYDITVQALTGFPPAWAAREGYFEKYAKYIKEWRQNGSTLAPRVEPWANYLRAAAERYDGVITMWEIWNEPDLDGFFAGTTEDYLELQRAAFEAIKSGSPQALVGTGGFATVGGHGGHALNPDLIRRTLLEAHDAFDYIAHHEHGKFPEFQSKIDGTLAEMVARMPEPRPIYYTETAIPSGGTDDGRAIQAETLVKKYAIAHARGAGGFAWFHMYRRNSEQDWGMLVPPSFEPQPILPAFTAMVRQLRNRRDSGQITMPGDDQWVFHFDDAQSRTLVAWTEGQRRGSQHVAVAAGEAKVTLTDLMGNVVETTTHDGVTLVDLKARPMYVHVAAPPTAVRLAGPLVQMPAERFVQVGEPFAAVATLTNPWSTPVTYALTWKQPSGQEQTQSVTVAANATAEATMDAPALEAGDLPVLKLAYAVADRDVTGEVRQRISSARTLPGTAAADREPDFALRGANDVQEFNKFAPGREHLLWQGPKDLSVEAWLELDGDTLVLVFDVRDDKHHQPGTAAQLWNADSVQYALTIPGREGRWELGVGRLPDGSTVSHAWDRPGGLADPVSQMTATSEQREGGIRYRVVAPLEALGLTAEQARRGFNFSFIVNDDDGEGRETFIQLTPGIGLQKDASHYPAVRFGR